MVQVTVFPTEKKVNTSSDPLATPRLVKDDGLLLLDYFAAHIASGMGDKYQYPETIAKSAYKIARAMLKERETYVGV